MNKLCQILVLILLCTIFISCNTQSKIIPFDSAKWKTSTPVIKHQMATDLIKNGILNGKTKSEVIELLGKPVEDVYSEDKKIYYELDEGYHFFSNRTYKFFLVVIFNKETEKVQSFGIID